MMFSIRRVHGRALGVISAALLLAVAGCGSDKVSPSDGAEQAATVAPSPEESESPTASPTEDTGLPSEEDVEEFFRAIGTNDVAQLEAARKYTEPGSVAEAYAIYRLTYTLAALDGAVTLSESTFSETEDGYEYCFEGDANDCFTVSDIEGRNGKVVNFAAQGVDLTDLIVLGSGDPVKAGGLGEVTMEVAYASPRSNSLMVVVTVRSGDQPIVVNSYSATYRSKDGRQRTAADAYGPTDLAANSTANIVLEFPQSQIGGVATLELNSEDFMNSKQVQLPTS